MKKFFACAFLMVCFCNGIICQVSNAQVKKWIKSGNTAALSHALNEGFEVNTILKSKSTLLHVAAEYGKYDVVKLLVKKGADLNLQDKLGNTPLMISTSVFSRNDSISKLLIESGASVNAVGKMGASALRNTVGIGGAGQQPATFKLLIDHGADILQECTDCCDRTLFLYCCSWASPDMLQYLLDKKPDIQKTDCDGLNGLMYAIKAKNKAVIPLLLKTDINRNHKDKNGRSVHDYAVETKDESIIQLIDSKLY
jgi:ankyrin repeat protein